MPNVVKYDQKGDKSGEFSLEDRVFADRIREVAVNELLLMQLSNRRRSRAKSKNRSEVRGGGRKPYRQKGTGRSRVGSTRSPVRVGGGTAMGPTGEQNYKLTMPRKVRRAAMRSLLSAKTKKGELAVIENVKLEVPKTKSVVAIIDAMQAGDSKVLFVIPERDYNFECSVRNLPNAKALIYNNLNPHDVMYHDRIVVFEEAVGRVTETLTSAKKEVN